MLQTFVLRFTMAAGLTVLSPFLSPAQRAVDPSHFTTEQLGRIEGQLLLCLRSDCPGVRATAALTIKQLKESVPAYSFRRSIIPLMGIVKDEGCDPLSRIAASLALHALNSSRGDFAIKATAYFTEDDPVRRTCARLTAARALERLAAR